MGEMTDLALAAANRCVGFAPTDGLYCLVVTGAAGISVEVVGGKQGAARGRMGIMAGGAAAVEERAVQTEASHFSLMSGVAGKAECFFVLPEKIFLLGPMRLVAGQALVIAKGAVLAACSGEGGGRMAVLAEAAVRLSQEVWLG